jgi:hypothetical protein
MNKDLGNRLLRRLLKTIDRGLLRHISLQYSSHPHVKKLISLPLPTARLVANLIVENMKTLLSSICLKYKLLLVAMVAISLGSCTKINTKPAATLIITSQPPTNADVYVAGYVDVGGLKPTAAYWKNDTLTVLGDSLSVSWATGIAVEGNDVYVVGGKQPLANFQISQAVLWKNGVPTILSPDSTQCAATWIALNGSNVYIGGGSSASVNFGVYYSEPFYWENGVPFKLSEATTIDAITFNGNDVYFAGAAVTAPFGAQPAFNTAYWKNGGAPVILGPLVTAPPSGYYSSFATSIAVSGSNVYLAMGSTIQQAIYWTNSNATRLSPSIPVSFTNSIAVNGNNVYVAGEVQNSSYILQAAVWQNNALSILPIAPASSSTNSYATAIALNGGDVFVSGYLYSQAAALSAAVYWQNGAIVQLSDPGNYGAEASSITVVPK